MFGILLIIMINYILIFIMKTIKLKKRNDILNYIKINFK